MKSSKNLYTGKNIKKILLIAIILVLLPVPAIVKTKHKEKEYQHAYCSAVGGIEEWINLDNTRIDCLTDEYVIEIDFATASKSYEAIGQALHYLLLTDKKAKVVLIVENLRTQYKYFERALKIGKKYDFEVDYITDVILQNKKLPRVK